MDKNAKPELTEKWWAANKAKTLLKTGVSDALRKWEAAQKAHASKTTLETYWAAVDALNTLEVTLESAEKKCKSIHKETKAGLVKMQGLAEKERKELVAINQRKWKFAPPKWDTSKDGVYFSQQVGPVYVEFGFEIQGLNPYDQQRLYDAMKPALDTFKTGVQLVADDPTQADIAVNAFRVNASKLLTKELNAIEKSRDGHKKHQVVIVAKGALTVGKIVFSVTRIVLTAGADVTAWVSLGKNIVGLAKLVYEEVKGLTPVFEAAKSDLETMILAQGKSQDFSLQREAAEKALDKLEEKINKASASQAKGSKGLDKLLSKRPEGQTPEEYEKLIDRTVTKLADAGEIVRKAESFYKDAQSYLDEHPNGSVWNKANAKKVASHAATAFKAVKKVVGELAL